MQKSLKKIITLVKELKIVDIFIIIAVILAAIIAFRFFNPEERWTTVTVSQSNIPFFQANAFRVGDVEKDQNGKIIARITDVQTYQSPQGLAANQDIFVEMKLLVKVNPRSRDPQYKNKNIKIGSPIELVLTSGLLTGKIAHLDGTDKQSQFKTKVITLRLYDQWTWFADAIKIGQGEIGEHGGKISEIISKEVKPAEITTINADGYTLLQTDPRKVDMTIKMKLKVLEANAEFVFRKNKPIIIGEAISFEMGTIKISDALIEKIE